MNRGVLLFAFNTGEVNYQRMAEFTAERVHNFLNLPVTLVTDVDNNNSVFDNVVIVENNSLNHRKNNVVWKNKGRFNAFTYTPYDDTIVLDVDYVINSSTLLNLFSIDQEIMCHYDIRYLFENKTQEIISDISFPTYWATVLRFKKTSGAKCLFHLIKMIENNYTHYSKIYKFLPYVYRNDYALSIALRTLNGQVVQPQHNIPWPLIHVESYLNVERLSSVEYRVTQQNNDVNKYIKIKNFDFHMLNKDNFMKLIT